MRASAAAPVLVTGSGGVLGRRVVAELTACGKVVRGIGRSPAPAGFVGEWSRCDLRERGELLEAVTRDISALIHCASAVSDPKADVEVMRNLIGAVGKRSIPFVFVSIAGIDRAAGALKYYQAKIECENLLRESGLSQLTVRIAQFHPFIEMILSRLTLGPIVLSPKLTLQPVDINFAAKELVRATTSSPASPVLNIIGPERLSADALIREWLRVRGKRKLAVPFPAFGPLRALSMLTPVEGKVVGETWSGWLQQSSTKENPYLTRVQ